MSRIDPRTIIAALLFATPLRAATTVSGVGPGARPIYVAGPINPPQGMAIGAARATGMAEGFRLVADAPGDWWSFALDHDSTMTWPAHTTIEVECGGGRMVRAIHAFAMSPPLEQRVIPVGGSFARELEPDRVWRRRFRGGMVATVIFARFPLDSCRGDITGLRVVSTRATNVTEGR